jgi:hypothetical protein
MPGTVASRLAPLLLLAIAAAGCVRSESTVCGDLICPQGQSCARGRCVDQSVVFACTLHADGASCTLPTIGTGTCQTGMCIVGTCGDGVVNAIDACDGRDLGGKTCLDFGSTDKAGLKCKADCSFDPSGCTAYCGDGIKHSAEECDGKDLGGKTCITEGFYGGKPVCTSDCKLNLGGCKGRCGDGLRNSFTEECDGTDFGTTTCALRGYLGAVAPLICSATCSFDPMSCTCGGELCAPNTQQCVLSDEIYSCEAVR